MPSRINWYLFSRTPLSYHLGMHTQDIKQRQHSILSPTSATTTLASTQHTWQRIMSASTFYKTQSNPSRVSLRGSMSAHIMRQRWASRSTRSRSSALRTDSSLRLGNISNNVGCVVQWKIRRTFYDTKLLLPFWGAIVTAIFSVMVSITTPPFPTTF